MHKRTKALMISRSTKKKVWERDGGACVLCGCSRNAFPEAHYISRAQGGLGIEENIVTLCRRCHDEYDNGVCRDEIRNTLREYLKSKYPDWDEEKLVYRK